ncbi:MAG TPA: hypothetical protein VK066_18555 [Chloroflexota bacterium]|nr:hypothetical protein [Chloroflexota bacterium]
MAQPTLSLDLLAAAIRPALLAAAFEDAGSGISGSYRWVRFRRQEAPAGERLVRLITLSHAAEEQAFLADAYLVARLTFTYTPVGKEIRRYGTPEEAVLAAGELAAAVRRWLDA